MRSLALLRQSAAMLGTATVVVATAHWASQSIPIPEQQLRLAWTLARALIQL
jgi:hypothetical protein